MTAADDSGARAIRLEVEVPGTPEQVWEAIATGHGISAWFVPTEAEGHVGGRVVQHFGEGLDAEGTITAFEPLTGSPTGPATRWVGGSPSRSPSRLATRAPAWCGS